MLRLSRRYREPGPWRHRLHSSTAGRKGAGGEYIALPVSVRDCSALLWYRIDQLSQTCRDPRPRSPIVQSRFLSSWPGIRARSRSYHREVLPYKNRSPQRFGRQHLVLLPRPVSPPAVIPFLSTPRGGLTHPADKGQPRWQSNGSTQDFSIYHHPFDRSSRLQNCVANINSVAFERNSDSVG